MSEIRSPSEQSAIEAGARAAWWWLNGEPTEPLRERGGALDPSAYCMKLATAISERQPLPHFAKDVDTPIELAAEVCGAMGLDIHELV